MCIKYSTTNFLYIYIIYYIEVVVVVVVVVVTVVVGGSNAGQIYRNGCVLTDLPLYNTALMAAH